ncbi:hypothetical protein ACHAWF_005760, partial [Thalassiosira exigua]
SSRRVSRTGWRRETKVLSDRSAQGGRRKVRAVAVAKAPRDKNGDEARREFHDDVACVRPIANQIGAGQPTDGRCVF